MLFHKIITLSYFTEAYLITDKNIKNADKDFASVKWIFYFSSSSAIQYTRCGKNENIITALASFMPNNNAIIMRVH